MIDAIRSEFRKLLSVRSTYGCVIVSLLIIALFAGYGDGFRAATEGLHNSDLLANESRSAIVFAGLILAFAGLLLAGNEYRFNTIFYTLTSVNRRYKILLAKFVAISVFALVMGAVVTFFSPLCTIIGLHLAGKELGPQTFQIWHTVWTCLFCGWGYAMYAFMLLLILRNQIGAIVTFLLIPLIGENIIQHLFEKTTNYLPFTAVQAVAQPTALGNHASSLHEVAVVLVYVVVGLLVSGVLFVKRDAN
jgi:ABC-type transport system involved in multi-copper enzyme maturation permease subunit